MACTASVTAATAPSTAPPSTAARPLGTWAEASTPYGGALKENPLGKPYDDQGNLIFLPTTDGLRSNHAAEVVPGADVAEAKTVRLFNSIYGEWKIVDGLKYRLNFGPDLTNQRFGRFTGQFTNARRGGPPTARTEYSHRLNYALENIVTCNKTFKQAHNLDMTALHSIQRDNYETEVVGYKRTPS